MRAESSSTLPIHPPNAHTNLIFEDYTEEFFPLASSEYCVNQKMFVEWKKLSQVNGWCGCIEDFVVPLTIDLAFIMCSWCMDAKTVAGRTLIVFCKSLLKERSQLDLFCEPEVRSEVGEAESDSSPVIY
jgi:hypothetical protein